MKRGAPLRRTPFKRKQPTYLKRIPIKPVSKKRKKENETYSELGRQFLIDNPVCEPKIAGCKGIATDVHHKRRRGKYFLDVSTWMAACRDCHDYIETHPKESREKGWIITS